LTNVSAEYKNRSIISDAEVSEMLEKADGIKNEYFRLRVKALIGPLSAGFDYVTEKNGIMVFRRPKRFSNVVS
jgi:hypothetical protein